MDVDELVNTIKNAPNKSTAQEAVTEALPDTSELSQGIQECSSRIEQLAEASEASNVGQLMEQIQQSLQALDNDNEPEIEPETLLNKLDDALQTHREHGQELSSIEEDLKSSEKTLEATITSISEALDRLTPDGAVAEAAIDQLEAERQSLKNLTKSIDQMRSALNTFAENNSDLTETIQTQRDRFEALTDALT